MLENIIKFQEIEKEVVALENSLANSKDRARASEIQKNLKSYQSKILELEVKAKKINEIYKKSTAKYNEYLAKLEDLEREISNADAEKMPFYEKLMRDLVAVSGSLDKDIQTIHTQILQINKEYEEIMKKSRIERQNFDKYKAQFSKLKAEIEPQIAKLKEDLHKIQKDIEPNLFAKYKQKRESRVFPVFVQLLGSKCGGCRMEISASKLGKMKTNQFGIIECENCGRYIYEKK